MKVIVVCALCGGQNVLADAYCEWNVADQRWEVVSIFTKGAFCNDCDKSSRIEQREFSDIGEEVDGG